MAQENTFVSDEPIETIAEDEFGREGFARNLARAIREYKGQDSLVIGLYGSWGSGKTSVINMITEELSNQENQNLVIIPFSPWYFSGQDQLLQQFFSILSQRIKSYLENIEDKVTDLSKQLGEALNRFSSTLKPIKYVTPFVGLSSETTEQILSKFEEVGKALSGLQSQQNFDPIAEKKKIHEILKNLNNKQGTKILVIIDDIDRLEKQEIRQIFQLVKGIANFPNTIYLLSFDVSVVTKALDDVQTPEGKQYLEKIVQVPFVIPEISRTKLYEYLHIEILKIVNSETNILFSYTYFTEILSAKGLRSYFDSIREVNRFLNIFQFEFSLLSKEVDTVELVVLSAIKSQDNELFNFIKNNKYFFCGGIPLYLDSEEYSKRMLEVYSKSRKKFNKIDIIEPVLARIFPDFRKQTGIFGFGRLDETPNKLKQNRRISHPDCFDSFFLLSLSEDQISRVEIQKIIDSRNNIENFCHLIESYIHEQRVSQLFNELRVHKQEFKDINFTELIRKISPLVDIIQKESNSDTYTISFSFSFQESNATEIALFIKDLIDQSNLSRNIFLELEEIFKDIEGFALPEYLFYSYATEFGFYTEDNNNPFSPTRKADLIEASDYGDAFKKVENHIAIKISKLVEGSLLRNKTDFMLILHLWKIIDPESAKRFFKEFTENRDNLVLFLRSSLNYIVSYPEVNSNTVCLTDGGTIKDNVRQIVEDEDYYNSLDEKSKFAVDTFIHKFE